MALKRGRDDGQAFRDDPDLRQFILSNVTPTGRILGSGSYGSVEEVSYKHLVCAGKKLHEFLYEGIAIDVVVHKYLQECQLMSSLHHPNITQFLGLCFLPGTQLPLLVMERLETSLDGLLKYSPNLPLSLKRSVLEDVACGLFYLHDRRPPVIHRDLTSKNILLTSSLVAKITDMGNSRIVTMRSDQMAWTLTSQPGTLLYMPPEAQEDTSHYGPSLDIFSFGHLALYTVTQKFPGNLLPATYPNPDNNREVMGRTEIERRGVYIELLERKICTEYSTLVELVKQCLQNDPRERPSTEELLTRLQGVRMEVEGEFGQDTVKLDLAKVKMAKQLQEKDRRLEELTQQQARKEAEGVEAMRRHVEETTRLLEERGRHVEELQAESQAKEHQIHQLQDEVANKEDSRRQLMLRVDELEAEGQAKEHQIHQLQDEVAVKEDSKKQLMRHVEELQANIAAKNDLITRKDIQLEEFTVREAKLKSELAAQAEMTYTEMTRESQRKKEPLKFSLQLTWRCGTDIPFEMRGHIQSVMVYRRLYVGGGWTTWMNNFRYIVMEYAIGSGKWTTLPSYRAHYFAMAVISNQLVLVGGHENDSPSKALGVWNDYGRRWTYPYPEMPTARSNCSVVTYNEWLVAAGGWGGGNRLSCVEVLNADIKQWYTGPPTPTPWHSMKTAVVGNMGYFIMGGRDYTKSPSASTTVYCVDIPALLSRITSTTLHCRPQIWKEIPGLKIACSTPLSISGCLLAIGGWDKAHRAVTDIHRYDPLRGVWCKVGDLPFPRYQCTCAMTADREVLVTGGQYRVVHIALIA